MSYSDDTAEFMFAGCAPLDDRAEFSHHLRCDSCWGQKPTTQITYGDGATFWLCEECRPFDVTKVTVVDITIDYDKETE
jgi:hypothetical protein